MSTTSHPPLPKSIIIVGSGVFGLSTALSLSKRASFSPSEITLIDRSPFPSPDGSSIDTSRIIRADYADPAYASLAAAGQEIWRQQEANQLGGEGRYSESGLVLVSNKGSDNEIYVQKSFHNVLDINKGTENEGSVKELPSRREIEETVGTRGGSGDWGYSNTRSGWADAEAGMLFLRRQVEALKRVEFLTAEVASLVFSGSNTTGVRFKNNSTISADLVILATGAWTPTLIDLRGRAQASGQVLSYLPISDAEQERLGKMPVLLNMSSGMFIIPPKNNLLKVARHNYGYSNPISIPNPEGEGQIKVSVPRTALSDPNLWIPHEGEAACRQALREMIPSLGDRPFTKTKICWYTDTPTGDFIITYHPSYSNLFLATGGSGHGYKFLPVIGDKIVDCIEGRTPEEFKEKWAWRKEAVQNVLTADGSRGGRPGMLLEEELKKGSKL
ncbi:hypothetical protein G7Y89_g4224 [Cudoniella acicularis]|uniref:FAD dependent oxidoreductase domain-containing protein n=1 Tax=Cudoniella acicularis TaxID=354080 RepID=A0A8H4RPW5_9HELO|nr:hypothetical protein G7Y89_g4224 [Cudoniella acicularis]